MNGRKTLGLVAASFAGTLALCAAACFLPDDPYQRWQLTDATSFEPLRWSYERIHFDPRPIDVAIVGPSKTLLGLSAGRIERQLADHGKPAEVANFSAPAAGRNVEWAVIDELFKAKSAKVIVVGVDSKPHPYGHPAFKYVAPSTAIVFTPAPLLHNYFYDLAYLPIRQVKLFAARLFPGWFGLRKEFDPQAYARTRSDFTSGTLFLEGKSIEMEHEVPRETLLAQSQALPPPTLVARLLALCCNDGDDPVYIRAIADEAKAHGAQLIFVYLPRFNEGEQIEDREFLERYGLVLDNGDLARRSDLFENWSHFNHAGATIVSDRVAKEIIGLKTANSDHSVLN